MITRAILRYIRITPRKFRQIIPLVKGKNPEEAIAILVSTKKNASKYGIDLLKSAIANAKRIQGVDVSSLYISKMIADGGPMLKRYRAASMGRASMIKKRTSHLTVELDAVKGLTKEPKEQAKIKADIKDKKTSQAGVEKARAKEISQPKKTKVKETSKQESSKKGKE